MYTIHVSDLPLEVIALSKHEWRISDPAKEAVDGIGLVGFVQRVAGRYEVTALGDPRSRTYFDTLPAAVGSLYRPVADAAA